MGKWKQDTFERVCAEKMKALFYKMHNQGDYDTELERRFREFVKTLDIDDDHVARQFRRLVDAQNGANAETERLRNVAQAPAGTSNTSRRRRVGLTRTYDDYAQSNIRDNRGAGGSTLILADDDPEEIASRNAYHRSIIDGDTFQHTVPYDHYDTHPLVPTNPYWGSVTRPQDGGNAPPTGGLGSTYGYQGGPPLSTLYTNPYNNVNEDGYAEDTWTDLGGEENFVDYADPFDPEVDDTYIPPFHRPQSASPPPLGTQRQRSQSVPYSLSHERQLASAEGVNVVAPIQAAAEYGPTYAMTPREAAPSRTILSGMERPRPRADGWLQAARDEIHDEDTRSRRGRVGRPISALPRVSANPVNRVPGSNSSMVTGTSLGPFGRPLPNPSTSLLTIPPIGIGSEGLPSPPPIATSLGPYGRPLSIPFTGLPTIPPIGIGSEGLPSPPPFTRPNRRRRDPGELTDGPEPWNRRNILRRIAEGDAYRPSEADNEPEPDPEPELPGVRMQRQRRSMPPLPSGHIMLTHEQLERERDGDRDRRRDGVIWEAEDLEYFFDPSNRWTYY